MAPEIILEQEHYDALTIVSQTQTFFNLQVLILSAVVKRSTLQLGDLADFYSNSGLHLGKVSCD